MAKTKKVSAEKIAQGMKSLNDLYAQFEAATTEEEKERLSKELVLYAFNPDAEEGPSRA